MQIYLCMYKTASVAQTGHRTDLPSHRIGPYSGLVRSNRVVYTTCTAVRGYQTDIDTVCSGSCYHFCTRKIHWDWQLRLRLRQYVEQDIPPSTKSAVKQWNHVCRVGEASGWSERDLIDGSTEIQ